MYNPVATYRFQFNTDFPLSKLDTLIPYLQKLGIRTVYASPIFEATPGSTHGYDGVDPNRISPEIGTEDQLRTISQQLKESGMGWLQDIVPNHMAYHPNNQWLMDVFEKGDLSRYANYFDTALASPFFQGRIMAAFLPAPLSETIANGDMVLAYDQDRLVLQVSGNSMPLKPISYERVLRAGGKTDDIIVVLLDELNQIHHIDEPATYAEAWHEFRQQMTALMRNKEVGSYIQKAIDAVNSDSALLEEIADSQHYRFCMEPESHQIMSYRRFFTINGLICLSTQEENVFMAVHQLTNRLVQEGVFQGVRVDHVDGLYDPKQYLERLRALLGPEAYISVEKILQGDEPLPTDWPIEGTSGYDFLAHVNNLLTDSTNESTFRNFYQGLIETDTDLRTRISYRKAYMLYQRMGGELENLYQYFIAQQLVDDDALAAIQTGNMKVAIGELLIQCPVYRYYANEMPLPADEAGIVAGLIAGIRDTKPELNDALDALEAALLIRPQEGDAAYNTRALKFYQRLMQFTSPLMAKGVEDTLLYTYNCFVGHNEVGDSPERFGLSTDTFHQIMQDRLANWPLAQSTTATHDTKRGEDVRARLNVVTELADEWLQEVRVWQDLNADLHAETRLDKNDEYFIYQNLLGAYPMPKQDEDNFPNRMLEYMKKSLQEAKRHTTGHDVEPDYFEAVSTFVNGIFDAERPFWTRFQRFHRSVADLGITNSLAQLVLKCTCPGVPDVYRGGESWDLSLVDPDNRRPVDFDRLCRDLDELIARQEGGDQEIWADLWSQRWDGRIKQWLTRFLLQERDEHADIFTKGEYLPLTVEGTYREHVLAFARRYESSWYVVAIPLHAAQLCQQQGKTIMELDWQDTRLVLPDGAPTQWTRCLAESRIDSTGALPIKTLLDTLPVALLTNR
ncbi:malto-oligosyltrehalose synthase [Spirosoma sp. KUDC1026]|uniref:malto-oligosyltrehalose synthase n=1 Tax=Spirosoma sp. KUDC1026 TaxID=2745947 RepID=UPI00159B9314|nr:malto-oligosyltrehalose synthase [Spirosoma sp. KUDC1026]QKZ11190.1 malto-oligosyltrehalose synthase [Spirosoma sp. KUDC1026]